MMSLVSCQSAASLQKERDYDAWEQSLTPDQRIRLEAARLQALGLALSGGPIFKTTPMEQRFTPPPAMNPRCFYNTIGETIYENCY